MSTNREQATNINRKGRDFLTLIRDAGGDGITRKGLTDALSKQLDKSDFEQLDALEAGGLITVERVDIVDHPDVEYLYRAGVLRD